MSGAFVLFPSVYLFLVSMLNHRERLKLNELFSFIVEVAAALRENSPKAAFLWYFNAIEYCLLLPS